jgi:DNA-directed RNA polymerase specialized sigma24 family protein
MLDDLVGQTPTPEFLAMLKEEYERLLSGLRDERLREIAISRVEGYTVAEIAAKLAIGKRAVERKLQLIRSKWAEELPDLS